jgi:CRISPR-associated protein Csa3
LPSILIATLGFDADLILRRLTRHGGYRAIKCLGLRVDEASFRRVENAFSTVKFVTERLNTQAELRAFEPGRGLVRGITAEIEKEAAKDLVEVYLSGGPRLLIVATLIATLLVDPLFLENITIVVEGEGFEGEIKSRADRLKKLIGLSGEEIDIIKYTAGKDAVKPLNLVKDLKIPKATAYKKLRKLATEGFLEEKNGEYILKQLFLDILF